MPPFRIHQTRVRPERILVRLQQGKYILASQQPLIVPAVAAQAAVAAPAPAPVEEKPKKVISLKQIKQIISLLQQSQHKNISKLLSPEIANLLTLNDQQADSVDEPESESDEPVLEDLDDDEDLLIIDV